MTNHHAPPPRGRVGIKRVAEEAGLSTATVSRVLSNSGYASDSARSRVVVAADRLGYRPDARARGLRTKRGTTLGVLVRDLTNPVILPFIRGVQHVAQPCGFAVVVGDAQRDAAVERHQLELFGDQRVAGVIVVGVMQDRGNLSVLEPDIAVVHSPSDLEAEGSGEDRAIGRAVDDLARNGHRLVLFVSRAPFPDPPGPSTRVELRRRAVIAAATRRDMEVQHCFTPMEFSTNETAEALGRWVGKDRPGHAVICASHRLAPQLLGTMSDMRLALPEDVSFITFGDSDWARAYRPAIAVLRVDRYREARSVTHDLLLEVGRSPDPEIRPSDPEFVARESVGTRPIPAV